VDSIKAVGVWLSAISQNTSSVIGVGDASHISKGMIGVGDASHTVL
jgi:hypothetical protein